MSSTCEATDSGPTSCFSCNARIGVTLIAESASLSCAAVLFLLSYVAYNAFRHRGTARSQFIRSHLDLYLLGLLLSDLVQAIGGMMDIRWVSKSGVFEGRFCTAQGVLEQFGDVGVALCSLAIATHTFAELVLRWREPPSFTLPIMVLSLYALFLVLIVGVGFAVHRHSVYYGNTTYWCWIRKEFINEGIGLEYLWLWIAAFINLAFYIPVFLVLKHVVVVESTRTWPYYRVRRPTQDEKQNGMPVNPRRMLYYPAVYIVTVLPIAVSRIHAFLSSTVPFPATVFSGILFSASGLFNVIVYTSTRPALLRPSTSAADAPYQPKVFSLPDQERSDADGRSSSVEGGERTPRLPDSAFDILDMEELPTRHGTRTHTRDVAGEEIS